jgi:predicted metal-dependent phosphoesterase TrpH
MIRPMRADLHVHTCLSPCGESEMTPRNIVRTCLEKKLDIIAICDHNSAENVNAVRKAAEGFELAVLAGIEITSAEEVHVLALFGDEEKVLVMQEYVYQHLLPGDNDENLFGSQVVCNEHDEVKTKVKKLLIGGTAIPVDQLIDRIHSIGGLSIASHIDRESYSLLSQLGMIPDDLKLDALEVSKNKTVDMIRKEVAGTERFPLVTSSDAHRLEEIGQVSATLLLEKPTLDEIRMAFLGLHGRKIIEGGLSVC